MVNNFNIAQNIRTLREERVSIVYPLSSLKVRMF